MYQTKMKFAGVVIFTAITILGIYDLAAVYLGNGSMSSISTAMYNFGLKSPAMCFTMGMVAGHLFFNMSPDNYDPRKPE